MLHSHFYSDPLLLILNPFHLNGDGKDCLISNSVYHTLKFFTFNPDVRGHLQLRPRVDGTDSHYSMQLENPLKWKCIPPRAHPSPKLCLIVLLLADFSTSSQLCCRISLHCRAIEHFSPIFIFRTHASLPPNRSMLLAIWCNHRH